MKIAWIHADEENYGEEDAVSISLGVKFPAGVSVPDALHLVTAKLLGVNFLDPTVTTQGAAAPASNVVTLPQTSRRRRGAGEAPSNPTQESAPSAPQTDVTAAAEGAASTSPSATTTRTRRGTAASAPQNPPPPAETGISDVDLGKAASSAAAELAGLGENGAGTVLLILTEDFKVDDVTKIPADQREKFLDVLKSEVALAKKEAADKSAQ